MRTMAGDDSDSREVQFFGALKVGTAKCIATSARRLTHFSASLATWK